VNVIQKITSQSHSDINSLIADIESQKGAYLNLIQTTRTNVNNADFVNRAIEGHRKAILFNQQMIEQYQNSMQNAPDIIADAQKQIRVLNTTLELLRQKRNIDKLKALSTEIGELQAELKKLEGSTPENVSNGEARRESADASDLPGLGVTGG
jgi:chromosome segregation ATPase